MGNKRAFTLSALMLLVLILAVGMAACNRPASKSPTGTSTSTAQAFMPGQATESMGIFDIPLTETAQAELNFNPIIQVATETPIPLPGDPQAPTPDQGQAGGEPAGGAGGGGDNQGQGQVQAATATPYAQPTAGRPATYVLQKGEFPFCIARRFNVNQSELLSVNGLGLNSQVAVGATLTIPQTGNTFVGERSLKSHPGQYTVAGGDTIYTIACKFGDVSPDMIAAANGLGGSYDLSAGQVLQIP